MTTPEPDHPSEPPTDVEPSVRLEHHDNAYLRLIGRAVKAETTELAPLIWSAAYFYFLLSSYYVLRPLRDELGTAGGVDDIKWLFSATLLAMLVLNPPFSWLVSRFRRERFIPMVYGFFALNIFVFFLLFRLSSGSALVYLGRTFYVWCGVYSLFIVSVFWGLMADVFTTGQAKRLFGFIAVGGTFGAITGASITRFFVASLGIGNLFLGSIALLLASVLCMLALTRLIGRRWQRDTAAVSPRMGDGPSEAVGGSAWSGIAMIFRSPYLLGITLFIMLYTITNTYLYVMKISIGRETIDARVDRIAFLANIDLFANVLTVLVQVFITSRMLTRLGIGLTLATLPAVSLVGFAILAWSLQDIDIAASGAGAGATAALVITAFESIRRASNYALSRPAREALYTVLGREEKYKSKSFIDTFFYRGGDQVGVWSHALFAEIMLLSAAAISMIVVPVAGLWLVLALLLGLKQRRLAARQDARGEQAPKEPRPAP